MSTRPTFRVGRPQQLANMVSKVNQTGRQLRKCFKLTPTGKRWRGPAETQKQIIVSFFNGLNNGTMDSIASFYDRNATFEDPLVRVEGIEQLTRYYRGLYENVTSIRFQFDEILTEGKLFVAPWTMRLRARNLNGGQEVTVPGISYLRFNEIGDRVVYHRDYFDLGAFIYEHVPVLKHVISFIKDRLSTH